MSAACGVLVLGRSSANRSLGRWWRGSRASAGRDRSHVHAGCTRAWRNVCTAVGRGGTEGCGSGWFHGGRKDVALDVGRVGFPGAPLEQNAGSPKWSGERQPVSVLCVSWGRRALPMVFARSLQPARALPMYVPLRRPRKTARCSGRGRKTPARSALAGWRKPTAAGAGRGAQGMCSGVWSEARGCERRGTRIGSSAGGA